MLSFLIVYFCTSAAMLDCEVFKLDEWQGPLAPRQCELVAAKEGRRLQLAYADIVYTRAVCEIQPAGE